MPIVWTRACTELLGASVLCSYASSLTLSRSTGFGGKITTFVVFCVLFSCPSTRCSFQNVGETEDHLEYTNFKKSFACQGSYYDTIIRMEMSTSHTYCKRSSRCMVKELFMNTTWKNGRKRFRRVIYFLRNRNQSFICTEDTNSSIQEYWTLNSRSSTIHSYQILYVDKACPILWHRWISASQFVTSSTELLTEIWTCSSDPKGCWRCWWVTALREELIYGRRYIERGSECDCQHMYRFNRLPNPLKVKARDKRQHTDA